MSRKTQRNKFSTQYDISDHVSLIFKALNLSNSAIIERGRFNNPICNT